MKVRKAVIPAAGLGTRFLPATKAQPKEMMPIVDKPTIQYIIEEAVRSGVDEILIITGRNKRAIEDHFDKSFELEYELEKSQKMEQLEIIRNISHMANIYYIRQREALGLGHAILCAKTFVGNEPFAVLLGDDLIDSKTPCLKQLSQVYEKEKKTILGVQRVKREDVSKYGIIEGDDLGDGVTEVRDMVEKPLPEHAPSDMAILGRYILDPEIFTFLENTKAGKNGEIQLTDALQALCKKDKVFAYEFEGDRYDIGDHWGFIQANIEFALKDERLKDQLKNFIQEKAEIINSSVR